MSCRRLAWLAVIAGCGDGGAPQTDAATDGYGAACMATYHGNFDEVASSPDPCASVVLASGLLAVAAPSTTLEHPLAITIALGPAPAIGLYSSETVQSWDARGAKLVTNEECLLVGGNDVTPTGSFTFTLSSLADDGTPSGTLDVALTVLQTPFTDCGAELDETVEVQF